ncbi:MAG: SDR family NAD(P)-dependent oxidoreductase [Bifidobacterium sp.]|nr:SDR family NAD(P)-dependent oxidoreductase [Bifidobacterium sp.]
MTNPTTNHTNTTKGRVLITGAAGGLGRAFAEVFAEHGHDLVLADIDEPGLVKAANELTARYGVRADYFPGDLSKTEGAQELYDAVTAHGIHVEQLVNNAGAGLQDRVVDIDPDRMIGLITLNAVSVAVLCRLFGADMVRAGHGRILNVSSLGALVPDPYFNVYGPTKAFEYRLTEAMYGELKGTGVTVSVLCPGPIKTNWAAHAGKADSSTAGDPIDTARPAYKAMQKGKLTIMPSLLNRVEHGVLSLLPQKARVDVVAAWQRSLIAKAHAADRPTAPEGRPTTAEARPTTA